MSDLGEPISAKQSIAPNRFCGGNDRPSTQVAAKVNKGEVTIHQVNFVLQRTPGIHAERIQEAKQAVVERLIDQEVLVQQAVKNKLD